MLPNQKEKRNVQKQEGKDGCKVLPLALLRVKITDCPLQALELIHLQYKVRPAATN